MNKTKKQQAKKELKEWFLSIEDHISHGGLNPLQWAVEYGSNIDLLLSLNNSKIENVMEKIDSDLREFEQPLERGALWIYYFGQLKALVEND